MKNPEHLKFEMAKKCLEQYFQIVDTVEHFTLTGGEPLLNKDLPEILKETLRYSGQVKQSIDFVTNATIKIPEDILEIFAENKEKTRIILSDYGKNLSRYMDKNCELLEKNGIPYRVSKFYGDDLYYDGWIDFTDHSLKWDTIEKRDRNASKCIHRVGKYFIIYDGELHCCSRSYWRMLNGIIPKTEGEYVPMLDEHISLERKRELLVEMSNKSSSTSCAYCVGLCNTVKREKPAQQLGEEL